MSEPLGSLCLVLHGHLPYVLNHGVYPHGENWLFEAAAETYLPILDVIGHCALMKARPALTIGLTPILLEQLSHPDFKTRFAEYLDEHIERAKADEKEFTAAKELHNAYLAKRWAEWYTTQKEHFERIDRDIPGEFAQRFRDGHIQILTSNATHAYMPLLLNDEMMTAQMSLGTATSKRILGIAPRGMWLPECAYRPAWEHWLPPVLFDNPRSRPGVEDFIASAGVTHFFVDTHLIEGGHPMGTFEKNDFRGVNEAQLHWDSRRGWKSVMEPVGVVSKHEAPKVFAFARHPKVSEQVWSGAIGYPGDGAYLEFHRKKGEKGLRYHKVTSTKTDLSAKEPYYPDDIAGKVFAHAQHFCNVVKGTLQEFKDRTGRAGTVVAPFDAELFGHWWFEGPQFLRDVILTLNNDPAVSLRTAEEALYHRPPDKVERLPEGSWGASGNHSVWMNDKIRWMWEIEYRAEGRLLSLLYKLPWKTDADIRTHLERAARELILLQASDWPFVVSTGGAVDYGIERLSLHAMRFERACAIAENVAAGKSITEVEQSQIAEIDLHDSVFKEIDLNWWMK